jgi:uncharacterized membrane protein YbhN (UPF0104 family)
VADDGLGFHAGPTSALGAGWLPSRVAALLTCALVAVTALVCAAILCAAVLVPARTAVVPFVVVVCVGCPMAAAYELPTAIAELRRPVPEVGPLAQLGSDLDALPETHHPLGL